MAWGGRRPGAGRKKGSPLETRCKRLSLRMNEQRYHAFKEVCAQDERTLTEAIEEYIETSLRTGTTRLER